MLNSKGGSAYKDKGSLSHQLVLFQQLPRSTQFVLLVVTILGVYGTLQLFAAPGKAAIPAPLAAEVRRARRFPTRTGLRRGARWHAEHARCWSGLDSGTCLAALRRR